jgi:uncharacterized SAM-binding protein YcdF (DUF218 family)
VTNQAPVPADGVTGGMVIDPSAIDVAGEAVGGEGVGREGDGGDGGEGDGAPRTRRRRRWLLAVLAFVVLLVGYYGINLFQVWHTGRSDQARPVDAIIVMGAAQYDGRPSPQLQARLDHVVELWNEGLAPIIVVTGGNQPGDRFTEASASAAYLTEHGVDPDAILQENRGRSSWESLRGAAPLLRAHGAHRVLLVSDPYHSLRIRLMAEDLGFVAYVSPTRTSPVRGSAVLGKEIKEAAGVAVGRIIGFGRLLSITG